MTRFLIAHSNCDMRTVLHEALFTAFEEQSGQPPQVIATSNTTEALTHCEVLDFDFIIMSLSLASRPNRPVGEREGLEL
ncbi:MAG: hypothetical protein MUF48_13740, partial [Pirellulaceae bacterium]|nr:hypothetical protein [Pirellulaceae bacterium]